MFEYIDFYNSMSCYERYLFRRLSHLNRKTSKLRRKLQDRIETIEELVDDVESTNN